MFIRPCYKKSNGKKLAYWALVESYRTAKGPRQRIVAYLGQLEEQKRKGVKHIAEGKRKPEFVQTKLFDDGELEPEWVEINANAVRVENEKSFGGSWLALQLIKLLGLDDFLKQQHQQGDECVSWHLISLILVICRLLNPLSELHIAEHFYKSTALADLLGVSADRINDDRLYRGLGDEPRRVLEELSKINLVDVVLPTSSGLEIRKRCITRPTEHQKILLQRLYLKLPQQFKK